MRATLTDAERKIWARLRNRQVNGCKFRRQVPVGPYIADFLCTERKLIVELDGGQHAGQTAQDAKRTAYLQDEGYKVLRFWNNEVLQQTDAVLKVILEAVGPSP